MTETTKLSFEARIAGVKPVVAKEYGTSSLELTLSISAPSKPREPHIPYQFDVGGKWVERPEDEKAAKAFDKARADYDAAYVKFVEAEKAARDRLLSYASLVGIAVVFGNQVVSVVMTPANQELLPGFAAALLPEAS